MGQDEFDAAEPCPPSGLRDSERVIRSEPPSPIAVAMLYHPGRWSDATLLIAAAIFDDCDVYEPIRWAAILDKIELAQALLAKAQ